MAAPPSAPMVAAAVAFFASGFAAAARSASRGPAGAVNQDLDPRDEFNAR